MIAGTFTCTLSAASAATGSAEQKITRPTGKRNARFIEGAPKLIYFASMEFQPGAKDISDLSETLHSIPTFLERLAAELLLQFPDSMEDVCLVFPTRRAG